MATVVKDFRVKAGLVVEGSTATVNGHDILTEGLVDAKGDLLVGTQDNTVTRVALGTDGYILTADANEASGVKWAAAPAVGTFTSSVTFEGATADSYQTTLEVTEPTADRTITLPNATGTVALTSDIPSSTDGLTEGTTNLYFTNQRAIDAVGGSATSANTPDTVVKRDANGDFAAGAITANRVEFGDAGFIEDDGNLVIQSSTSDVSITGADDVRLYANDDITLEAANGQILLDTNDAYFGNNTSAENRIATEGYVTNAITNIDLTFNSDEITEGTTNLYFTNQRALDATASAYDTTGTAQGIVDALDTDDIEEGTTNKYFSTSLVDNHLSGGDGINYSAGTISAHLGNGLEISVGGEIQIDDTVVATETDLSNAITAHNASSGVHGVTGSVVGTTDTQTLSNKTLGSALAAGGYKITGLGSPDNSTDAATKGYVDAVSEGLHIHEAARVAINGNISIANGLENGDTAGGVTLATGDRVLVKDQTNAAENGIYVVQASGQALRATDFDTAVEVDSGDFIFVTSGTYANTGWVQTLKPATIGTDALSFTQFSGAGTFTAGNGLYLDGTVFEIDETITATRTHVQEEVEYHSDLTTNVHGVTGELVGTSDTQSLSNKSLGAGTTLAASIDAVNVYTISNLQDPVSNQDAATKFYVDEEITTVSGDISDVAGDLSTHEGLTEAHGATGAVVGTTNVQDLSNKRIIDTLNFSDGVTVANEGEIAVLSGTHEFEIQANNGDLTLKTMATGADVVITSDSGDIVLNPDGHTYYGTVTPNNELATIGNLQDGDSTATPAYTGISLPDALIGSALATAGTSATTIDTWSATTYSTAKYIVQMKNGNDIEVIEMLVTIDGNNNVYLTEYADVISNAVLGTTNAVYSSGNVLLQVTGAAADTSVKVSKTYIEA
jgi:hypothetical protein